MARPTAEQLAKEVLRVVTGVYGIRAGQPFSVHPVRPAPAGSVSRPAVCGRARLDNGDLYADRNGVCGRFLRLGSMRKPRHDKAARRRLCADYRRPFYGQQ